jgi:4-oxalocrotonate tautomerase
MPLVNIKLIEGVFTAEQKRQMIERVTDALVSVEGESMRPLTLVIIDDNVKSGDWGIARKATTVENVRDVQRGTTRQAGT